MTKWTRPEVLRRTEAAYAWVTPTRLAESTCRQMVKVLLMVLMLLMVLLLIAVIAVQSDLDDLVIDPDPPVPVRRPAWSDRLDEDSKLFQACVRPHPHP